nr:DDT domain-containing protein PTM-like [Ipomoea batatas]
MVAAAMGRVERRGRKRRRNDVQSVEADQDGKKRMVGTRSKVLVGRYVSKEFEGSGTFLGKIMSYDSGLYRVNYEDGDCEDLDSSELKGVLIEEDELDRDWLERKKKLDKLVSNKEVTTTDCQVENAILPADVAVQTTAPPSSNLGSADPYKVEAGQVDDNAGSMSDLSDEDEVLDLISNVETPVIPPPELPPSSGNVGVPEEFVSYLFSVYSFLRSFSIQLFLSPFALDDFVGSLNCPSPNTLLDSVHVALMRVLRRHIEKLSLDGSGRASKCLRNLDWSLLDSMTWPIYLVDYLMIMGYINGPVWKGFSAHVLEREYYSLSVGQKLMVLQILCDDVLDSEEVRAEMDIREESEFGMDSDGTAVAPMSGPRRVHPRYSKTSAFKEQESMEIIAKDHDMRSSHNASSLSSKVSSTDAGADVDHDGNGDECRLCGMEGTLLCCDGCPSSYHPRCIGVCKMYIPDGNWYCPECRINELRPTPIRGTSLKGAELFGVDSHGQIFMGSCDHLLVLKDSANSESCFRYYNENDISRVLQALNTNVQHHALYSEICKGIREFWGIPFNVLPHTRVTEIGTEITNRIEDSGCSVPSLDNLACCASEISLENTHFHKYPKELVLNEASGRIVHPDNGNFTVRQASEHMNSVPLKQIPGRPTVCAGSVSQQVDFPRQTQKDNTVLIETASCTSRNISNCIGYDSVHGLGAVPSERSFKNPTEGGLYTGTSFKAQGYANNYLHGDFAASAAANLAILSSEENQCSESLSLEKRRKLMSVDIQLQTKAFSSAATRFFWPNIEKKLIEVPRERCSWCLSCKAPVVSKKACLLNAAASNATKGAMKILATVRPAKSGDGNLPGIATYIILMEESLRGLTVGPFLSAAFRKNWRKLAEEATSCYSIKSLLLELEENIRTVALSADWVKLVDGSSESSVSQNASSVTGSTHKRKPGRRGRKPSAVSVVAADEGQGVLTDYTWWRVGMLSKFMFQRGTLPQSLVNKAARQGGKRKIPGIYYSEGSETPKRNRRLVWRAAVEMCKTASQLALQVRYLDMHVRWSDLVRPEPSLQEGKGLETEASAFRNAFICDKAMVDNEVRYGVAFGNQKHLSSRVMKSVIEIGQRQDGKEKYWFSESRIPLYLIKEYEATLVKNLPSPIDNPMNAFSKWSKKSSKTFRGDIFSYLSWKRDGNDKHSCASCQTDVLLRYLFSYFCLFARKFLLHSRPCT